MGEAIHKACLLAIISLGDKYKGMSCFLYNWKYNTLMRGDTHYTLNF